MIHSFPGGKKCAVTFSYDDGHSNDGRLIEIFNKYGIKATFNLCSAYTDMPYRMKKAELARIYSGHEVANHTHTHPYLDRIPDEKLIEEVTVCRDILERFIGYPIRGLAYPYDALNEHVKNILRKLGVRYARTTGEGDFSLPSDMLEWMPTCHHDEALAHLERLDRELLSDDEPRLFFVWGHSRELESEADWRMMEKLCHRLHSRADKIWFATNMEICEYLEKCAAGRSCLD